MNRTEATKFLRQLLDQYELKDWSIRLNPKENSTYYGLTDHNSKSIILNALYIDTAPNPSVINTIRHEVAHALVGPGHKHDEVWQEKARQVGCDNTMPCSTFAMSPTIIDAIRSGADVEVSFETQVTHVPKYTIRRLQERCPVCQKVAKVTDIKNVPGFIIKTFECLHIEFIKSSSTSKFEDFVFDEDKTCKHVWGTGKYRTRCINCDAKKLYPYQIEGCRFLELAAGRGAILDEQGLGKTIQGLVYIRYNLETSLPYLWVTKSKILIQHASEIRRILGNEYFPQIILKSTTPMIEGFKGYMMSYDMFRRVELDMIKNAGIKLIFLDECQAIKNPDSARTIAIREVVKNIPKIIPASGTFWKNRGSEAFVMLNMLDPKMFWSFAQFKRNRVRYITDPETGKEREGGFINPEKFREDIAHIAIRRERKEVMSELPLANRTKMLCEVPEHARSVYNSEVKKLQEVLKDAAIDGTEGSFAVQSQLQQSIIIMRQIVGLAKVPSVVEYLQEHYEDTSDKIVCFVHHIKVGELIFEQMSAYCAENDEAPPIQMLGGTGAKETGRIQDEFNNGKTRLLVASTLSAGEGLNLQKNCSKCIIAERQWNPANEEQAEGRFIRIGQDAESVDVIYALADKTVDTTLDKLVEFKRREFHAAMNKSELQGWNEESLFKQMVKAIAQENL